jgi:hypothetical protein
MIVEERKQVMFLDVGLLTMVHRDSALSLLGVPLVYYTSISFRGRYRTR